MNRMMRKIMAAAMAAAWMCGSAAGALATEKSTDLTMDEALQQGAQIVQFDDLDGNEVSMGGNMVEFRPVDCGTPAQEIYEYPFIGMTAKLTDTMLEKMENRDVYLSLRDDYADATTIRYAMMRFFAPNSQQKEQKGYSVDIIAWEDELEKIGVLGVYNRDALSEIDALTGCDTHTRIGESEDGAYSYYLSVNAQGNAELIQELEKTNVEIGEMRAIDLNEFYSAFSIGRVEGVSNVGSFETEDVLGEKYTQDMFSEYDLTLVNVFATWCSPCVEEMPELEKLRQEYAQKGVRLGVVGMVMDLKMENGSVDEGALERAQLLIERGGLQFPLLAPDEGNMNGCLQGLESYPETFFVDREGNIVSEAYLGARSAEEWAEIVDQELKKVGGNQ